jgi:ribosomal protein S3AE
MDSNELQKLIKLYISMQKVMKSSQLKASIKQSLLEHTEGIAMGESIQQLVNELIVGVVSDDGLDL